jgi:hypothetical protein
MRLREGSSRNLILRLSKAGLESYRLLGVPFLNIIAISDCCLDNPLFFRFHYSMLIAKSQEYRMKKELLQLQYRYQYI